MQFLEANSRKYIPAVKMGAFGYRVFTSDLVTLRRLHNVRRFRLGSNLSGSFILGEIQYYFMESKLSSFPRPYRNEVVHYADV